jgi:tetratricopeptide (TPR) repeat protein
MSEAIEAAEEIDASFFESSSDWAIPEVEEEMPAATPMAAAPAPASEPSIDPDLLERTAAELHPQTVDRDEDLVSEAEVLAKYGLEEKALERLREALRLQPRHLGAHALMIQLHLDKGRHARVIELANHMAQIAATVRDAEPWNKVRRRLVAAGYRFEGERTVGPTQVRPEQNVDQLLRGILGDTPAKKAPAPPPVQPLAAAEAAGVFLEPAPVESLPSFPLGTEELELPSLEPAAPAPPAAGGGSFLFDPLSIGEMVENEDEDDWAASRSGRTRFSVGGVPAASPAPAPVPPGPPAAIPPPSPPRQALDDTGGLSWLDDSASRQPAAPRPSPSDFFDEENDFFDLAGELEQELSQEDVFQADELLMPSEQSLEEIVEGFKKGVAEHLSPTDYETHFNLGIAYREMGLLDEAIGEFQLAAKSPAHLVSCCSMLGICFLDKGLPALAVKWYRRGLEAPGINEEDTLGLLYDLGCAYLTQGETESAYRTFVELYGVNSNYRDVVARLEELGPR